MKCPYCVSEFDATNQHSKCPKCGETIGTETDRDFSAAHEASKRRYEYWETGTRASRQDSERARDYYDGKQWTSDEQSELKARGQSAIVKNHIGGKVDFLTGGEIESRTDPRALPRTMVHDDDANAITDALRYVFDDQEFDGIASEVFEDLLVEGYGGCVVEHEIIESMEPMGGATAIRPRPNGVEMVQAEISASNESVEIRHRYVEWDRLWYDVHSRRPDFSDALDKGIVTWWDEAEAVAYYKSRTDSVDNVEQVCADSVDATSEEETHADKPDVVWASKEAGRRRLKVIERYYQEDGQWNVCHFSCAGFLVKPKPTGYKDERGNNVCPLVMISAFVSRQGFRYGLVDRMIGPQDEINKRSSKMLYLMSTEKVLAEKGAVLDPEGAKQDRARPDSWIDLERDALVEGRFKIERNLDLAQAHMMSLQEAKREIEEVGPGMSQISDLPASASGRAVISRQRVGNRGIAKIRDHLSLFKRHVAAHTWWRIKQFWPEEKWFRVRDDANREGYRFVSINRGTTRGERFQEMLEKRVPMQSAIKSVLGGSTPAFMQRVMQENQARMGAMGAQPQQIPPEQMEQGLIQAIMAQPEMAEPMKIGDVAQLSVDIVLDESPDVAIMQQEEFESLTRQFPAFLQARPDMAANLLEMMVEASQLRNKRKMLEMMRQPPNPQAAQQQQMTAQLEAGKVQSEIAKNQSQAQLNQAKAMNEQAELQVSPQKAEAEIAAKHAGAMHDAAIAGARAGGDL